MRLDFLLRLFRRMRNAAQAPDEEDRESMDPDDPFPGIVTIEFQDVLDLHSIPPRQVRAVVTDYIDEAHNRGVRWVRIIHGKGIGVQREIVRSLLTENPWVIGFRDAPAEAGGWGATVVTLRERCER